jgi:2-oxoglutarate ferredoxin oxidoreductase subunit beta
MVMRQKSGIRPDAYRDTVDTPFRSTELRTGVLATNERPEYGAAYRAACARTANAGKRGAT